MKPVLLLLVLLGAAFAAPAEEQKPAEKVEEVQTVEEAEVPETVEEVQTVEEAEVPEAELRFNFCPDGWFQYESRCFKLINIAKSWYDAEEYCNNLGGHLASVTNPRQYSFLQEMSKTASKSIAWLGGFNLQGRWLWIDREGFYYSNWYSQGSTSSYPCIYLNSNYGWSNRQCSVAYPFICTKNPFGC